MILLVLDLIQILGPTDCFLELASRKSLEKIENHNITNIVLTGDFNCPDIRWDTQTACEPDREIQQGLADLMGANNLTQIHDSPTLS
jgi:hypothetical protein